MLFGKKLKEENAILLNEKETLLKQIEKMQLEIASLKEENGSLNAKVQSLNSQINQLNDKYLAFIQAEKSAREYREQLDSKTVENYNLQFNRLKAFINRWQANLPESRADTPENKKRVALAKLLSEILQENTPVSDLQSGIFTVERLNDVIGGKNIGGESTFDLDAVLNPSADLDLETLCKELGVME